MVPRIVSAASAKYRRASSSVCHSGALNFAIAPTDPSTTTQDISTKQHVSTVDLRIESHEARYFQMFDKFRTSFYKNHFAYNRVSQRSAVCDKISIGHVPSFPINCLSSQDSSIQSISEHNRSTIYMFHRLFPAQSVAEVVGKRSVESDHNDDRPALPEPPTDCCMSGCANCVWIQYADELKGLLGDSGKERVLEEINKIQNPGLQMFIKFELGYL